MATSPTQVVQYQTGLPPETALYGQQLLGQAAGLIYDYAKDASGNPIMVDPTTGKPTTDGTGIPQISGFKPYQQYTGDRVAQFTPLQQQAFQSAQNLGVDPATRAAAQGLQSLAQSAAGTTYNPFAGTAPQMQGPQDVKTGLFTDQGIAGAYMSPYMQNVVDVQQQQAKRQAAIAQQALAAQAARSGAFGGSGAMLQRAQANAELQRNLQNIQATGLQNAYQQAMQQYSTDAARQLQAAGMNQQTGLQTGIQNLQSQLQTQQLGEQSRQFGAGLGLQGIQTGLQGMQSAGQMGQTAFGQQQAAIGLQNQLGTQQQQQAQNILNNQYQDFLNAQNQPYKQLGFMSDMIRGLPMSQTSQTMYQAPGSLMGQVAGLGMGAYGLSKLVKDGGLINSYAEGGEVKTYAGDKGSVTSDYFERSALDDIRANDGALQKARQAALARRDLETVNYIDKLLAENVSMRSGLGGAFNSLSPEVQDNIVAAAGGGIVAFAKGGDKGEEVVYQDPLGAPDYEVDTQALSRTFSPKQNVREGETYTPGLRGMLFGYDVLPREEKAAPKVPAYSDSDAAERADRMTGTTASSASTGAGVKEALKVMADAHGLSVNSLMGAYEQMRDRLSAENKPILDRLDKLGEKLSGRADKIRSEMLPKMLAEFGFQWAAGAAKPGQARRPGLAGALESAAAASPALAASAAESQKAIDKAEDAYTLLQMENAKYRLAMQKGDNATAMQHATNMRQLEVSMRQLQLQAQQIAQAGAYQQGMLGIHGEELGIKKELAKSRGISAAASALQGQARVADVARKAGLDFDNSRDARTLMKQLTEQYGPDKARYMYGQQRRAYISDNTQGIRDQVSQDAQVRNVYDLLSE